MNPYESPRECGKPATTPRPRWLRPFTAPFICGAIGFSLGALYAIGYFLAHFLGVLEPWKFLRETLEAVFGFGGEWGLIGAAIGLALAPILWLEARGANR